MCVYYFPLNSGSGVARGGPEVRFHKAPGFHQGSIRVPPRFHQGSTRVPPGFHQGSTRVPRGSERLPAGASTNKSTACCRGYHLSLFISFYVYIYIYIFGGGVPEKRPHTQRPKDDPKPHRHPTYPCDPNFKLAERRIGAIAPWRAGSLRHSRPRRGVGGGRFSGGFVRLRETSILVFGTLWQKKVGSSARNWKCTAFAQRKVVFRVGGWRGS